MTKKQKQKNGNPKEGMIMISFGGLTGFVNSKKELAKKISELRESCK